MWPVLELYVRDLAADPPEGEQQVQAAIAALRKKHRKHKMSPKKSQLIHVYDLLTARGSLAPCPQLRAALMKNPSKSQSGVLVITVLTSPYPATGGVVQRFSCKWDCHYCPNEPGQPRSYLHDEPAVRRANHNGFDPVLQFTDRAATLAANGHPVDKIEVLVLGGTWASYPEAYRETFCRDLFYAANTCWERPPKRPRRSLAEEQVANEGAACKVIGLTLETRPDTIDAGELRRLRAYGCTRVQLGLQHTDDAVLKAINRGCTTAHAAAALAALKDCCYKVDIHLMPNLPGSSPSADRAMFARVLSDPQLQADQWKIYPCEVVPWTQIQKWYDAGTYVPYSHAELCELLLETKAEVHPWIRLNRVIRDIPSQYIFNVNVPNLREDLATELARRGGACACIRCREVGAAAADAPPQLVERRYAAQDGWEVFLSFESGDRKTIFAFARLRLSARPGSGVFASLAGCALLRELHVYGQLIPTTAGAAGSGAAPQHTGLGRRLMHRAEAIASASGFRRMAVIAGVGARGYYRKLGYELESEGGFMVKVLPPPALRVRLQLAAGRVAVAAWGLRLASARGPPLALATTVLVAAAWGAAKTAMPAAMTATSRGGAGEGKSTILMLSLAGSAAVVASSWWAARAWMGGGEAPAAAGGRRTTPSSSCPPCVVIAS